MTRKDLEAWIEKNKTQVYQNEDVITLGHFRQTPEAWLYTQVINVDNVSHQLVVDEFNHVRCDKFEVYTFKDGVSKKWGSIERSTRFSDYPNPFFTYAIPIIIQPKDTLNLLIHSERHYGTHEVNLGISTSQTYLNKHIYIFLNQIFQFIILVICTLIMFVLGAIYRYKTMTYLGAYLISLILSNLFSFGFSDSLLKNTGVGLWGGNSATFGVFLSLFSFFPFFVELMKVIPKNERVFNVTAHLMRGTILLSMCCYLLPKSLFDIVYAHIDLPLVAFIILALNLIWTLLYSFWALYKAKVYYLILGFGFAYVPLLAQMIVFNAQPTILLRTHQSSYISYAVGFTIITIYLLRQQLISRKKHEESIKEIKESMEAIRKTEVEAIGRDLHDSVSNTLVSALGYLQLKTPQIDVSQK
ncbi:MAG: hypothetical protein MUE30_07345, partial [Spirosomaceae bacterium]|nr:hypothetical protein [Spirosomataceae bacterium]